MALIGHRIAFCCSCSPDKRRAVEVRGYETAEEAVSFFVEHEREEGGPGTIVTVTSITRIEYQLADWSE